MAQKAKENRTGKGAPGTEDGLSGSGTPWEQALGYIDFNFQRGTAADKARFKNVLFSAKANKPQAA